MRMKSKCMSIKLGANSILLALSLPRGHPVLTSTTSQTEKRSEDSASFRPSCYEARKARTYVLLRRLGMETSGLDICSRRILSLFYIGRLFRSNAWHPLLPSHEAFVTKHDRV